MITRKKTKVSYFQSMLFFMLILLFLSCQKDLHDTNTAVVPGNANPDLTTKVVSSVSGFVTDENNTAVIGAAIKVGNNTTVTDKYGYFKIINAEVIRDAATVIITQPGYFNGIKTYIAASGKAAFFRIRLIPKTSAGTVNSVTGGSVSLSNGLNISLPENAVVIASTGAAYTGNITVAAAWIDPAAADLGDIMPGDLRGLNDAGALQILQTFGMAAVELRSDAGELLQIANGKKANLTMNIPAALAGNAPASIPLWYFDENLGLWKQEGTAAKNGNSYTGEVSHFSFWNCDAPANYVQVNCTVLDANGNPIPFVQVKISVQSNPYNCSWGYTDSTGYVGGAVPGNTALRLEVLPNNSCGTAAYTQDFTTTDINLALGNLTVPNSITTLSEVSGTVTDCNSNPVTNGYIMVTKNSSFTRYDLSATGTYNFSTLICNDPTPIILVAEDVAGAAQGTAVNYNLTAGSNTINNIQACGVSTSEFIYYTVDGADSSFLPPDATFTHSGDSISNSILSAINSSNSNNCSFSYDNQGIALNSSQPLVFFSGGSIVASLQLIPLNPISVNITEYGTIGQFIGGNFSGVMVTQQAPIINYHITCNFRVRRQY